MRLILEKLKNSSPKNLPAVTNSRQMTGQQSADRFPIYTEKCQLTVGRQLARVRFQSVGQLLVVCQ